jgi:hypothetical protein
MHPLFGIIGCVAIQVQQAVAAFVHRLQAKVIDRFNGERKPQARNMAVDGARGFAELTSPDHCEDVIARQDPADVREEQQREPELRTAQSEIIEL